MNKKLSVSNTASELTAKPDTAGGLSLVDKRALPRALRNYLALQDFIDQARKVLPRPIYGYITGGVENNISLRGNREVFDEIGFVPKPLVDTTQRSMKTELFGKTYSAPFGFAPMGGTSIATYQGDLVLARAAEAANIPMMMSGTSLMKMEDVRAASNNTMFQAYLPGDEDRISETFERAAAAGFETIAVTVDVAVAANRENNVRAGFNNPLRPTPAGMRMDFAGTEPTNRCPTLANRGDRRSATAAGRGFAAAGGASCRSGVGGGIGPGMAGADRGDGRTSADRAAGWRRSLHAC